MKLTLTFRFDDQKTADSVRTWIVENWGDEVRVGPVQEIGETIGGSYFFDGYDLSVRVAAADIASLIIAECAR